MKSKSKTTQRTTLPKWLNQASEFAVGRGREIANRQYEGYEGERVAGLSGNEQAAYEAAQGISGRYRPLLDRAGEAYSGEAVGRYMNPYVDRVLGQQTARINAASEARLADLRRKRGMMDAFGTDRGTALEGRLEAARAKALQDAETDILSRAFESGQSAFFADRESALRAAAAEEQLARQEIGALMTTGLAERGVRQAQADFDYGQFLERRDWSVNNLQPLLAAIQGARTDTSTTTTSKKSQSVGSTLVGIASTLAGAYLTGGGSLFSGGLSSGALSGIASRGQTMLGDMARAGQASIMGSLG